MSKKGKEMSKKSKNLNNYKITHRINVEEEI